MRQGLFQRKGASSMTPNPSPMSDGKKPSVGVGATGAASDSAPVRTSNSGSDGPGDQGSADEGEGQEMVQCPNCGCQFDAEDPTNAESYVPPEQAPDGSPSQMSSAPSSSGMSDIASMLGMSGGAAPGGSPG